MSYATRSDLGYGEELLLWLTDADSAGAIDEAAITAALASASRRINTFIAQRYQLPWDDSAGQLKDLCVALARYALYTLRPDGPDVPEAVKADLERAERDLRAIADGRLSLAGASLAEDNPVEPGKLHVRGPLRRFSRDTLDQW